MAAEPQTIVCVTIGYEFVLGRPEEGPRTMPARHVELDSVQDLDAD
jgi:hypothetical protein